MRCMVKRLLAPAATVVLVAVVGACSQPAPVSREAETPSFHVQLDLDGASLGRRTASVRVTGSDRNPVAAEQVVVSTAMPDMDMPGPTVVADEIESGRYEATGELFPMLGEWDLTVRIEETGASEDEVEEATFTIEAVP